MDNSAFNAILDRRERNDFEERQPLLNDNNNNNFIRPTIILQQSPRVNPLLWLSLIIMGLLFSIILIGIISGGIKIPGTGNGGGGIGNNTIIILNGTQFKLSDIDVLLNNSKVSGNQLLLILNQSLIETFNSTIISHNDTIYLYQTIVNFINTNITNINNTINNINSEIFYNETVNTFIDSLIQYFNSTVVMEGGTVNMTQVLIEWNENFWSVNNSQIQYLLSLINITDSSIIYNQDIMNYTNNEINFFQTNITYLNLTETIVNSTIVTVNTDMHYQGNNLTFNFTNPVEFCGGSEEIKVNTIETCDPLVPLNLNPNGSVNIQQLNTSDIITDHIDAGDINVEGCVTASCLNVTGTATINVINATDIISGDLVVTDTITTENLQVLNETSLEQVTAVSINVSGCVSASCIMTNNITATSITAEFLNVTTIEYVNVEYNNVSYNGNLTVVNNVIIGGNITVGECVLSDCVISDNITTDQLVTYFLMVYNSTVIDGSLTVHENITVDGCISSTCVITLNITSEKITTDQLVVNDNITVNGNITVAECINSQCVTTELMETDILTVHENVTVDGCVSSSCVITLNITSENIITEQLVVNDEITANGNITVAECVNSQCVTTEVIETDTLTVTQNITVDGCIDAQCLTIPGFTVVNGTTIVDNLNVTNLNIVGNNSVIEGQDIVLSGCLNASCINVENLTVNNQTTTNYLTVSNDLEVGGNVTTTECVNSQCMVTQNLETDTLSVTQNITVLECVDAQCISTPGFTVTNGTTLIDTLNATSISSQDIVLSGCINASCANFDTLQVSGNVTIDTCLNSQCITSQTITTQTLETETITATQNITVLECIDAQCMSLPGMTVVDGTTIIETLNVTNLHVVGNNSILEGSDIVLTGCLNASCANLENISVDGNTYLNQTTIQSLTVNQTALFLGQINATDGITTCPAGAIQAFSLSGCDGDPLFFNGPVQFNDGTQIDTLLVNTNLTVDGGILAVCPTGILYTNSISSCSPSDIIVVDANVTVLVGHSLTTYGAEITNFLLVDGMANFSSIINAEAGISTCPMGGIETSSISGCDGNPLTLQGTIEATNLTVTGELVSTGATTLENVNVTQDLKVHGFLTTLGFLNASSGITTCPAGGLETFSISGCDGDPVTFNGPVVFLDTVAINNLVVTQILNVTGESNMLDVFIEGNLTVQQNVTFEGTLNVTGGQVNICPLGNLSVSEISSCDGVSPIIFNSDIQFNSNTTLILDSIQINDALSTCPSGSIETSTINGCGGGEVNFPGSVTIFNLTATMFNFPNGTVSYTNLEVQQNITAGGSLTIEGISNFNDDVFISGSVDICPFGVLSVNTLQSCGLNPLVIASDVTMNPTSVFTVGSITASENITTDEYVNAQGGFNACPSGIVESSIIRGCNGNILTIDSPVNMTNNVTIHNLNITGAFLINGSSLTIVNGNFSLTNLNVSNDLLVEGNATFEGNVDICPSGILKVTEIESCDGMGPVTINNNLIINPGHSITASSIETDLLSTCPSGSIETSTINGCGGGAVDFPGDVHIYNLSATIFNFNGSLTNTELIVNNNATIGANLTVGGNTLLEGDVTINGDLDVCPSGTIHAATLGTCDIYTPLQVTSDIAMNLGTTIAADQFSANGAQITALLVTSTLTAATINSTTIYNSGLINTCNNGKIQTSEIDTCSGGNLNITAPVVITGGNGITSSGAIVGQSTLSISSTSTLDGLVTSSTGFSTCPSGSIETSTINGCGGGEVNFPGDVTIYNLTASIFNFPNGSVQYDNIIISQNITVGGNVTVDGVSFLQDTYIEGDLNVCPSGVIKGTQLESCDGISPLTFNNDLVMSPGTSISSDEIDTTLLSTCPSGSIETSTINGCGGGEVEFPGDVHIFNLSATIFNFNGSMTYSSLIVDMNATIGANLTVNGDSFFEGDVNINGELDVCPTGKIKLTELQSCDGMSAINIDNNLNMINGTTIDAKSLNVATNLHVSSSSTFDNLISADGGIETCNSGTITTTSISGCGDEPVEFPDGINTTQIIATTINVTNLNATNASLGNIEITDITISGTLNVCTNDGQIETNTLSSCSGFINVTDATNFLEITEFYGNGNFHQNLSVSNNGIFGGSVTAAGGVFACPSGQLTGSSLGTCDTYTPLQVTSDIAMNLGTTLAADQFSANGATITNLGVTGIFVASVINSTTIYNSGVVSTCGNGKIQTNEIDTCTGGNLNITAPVTITGGNGLTSSGAIVGQSTLSISSTSTLDGLVTSATGLSTCPSGSIETSTINGCGGGEVDFPGDVHIFNLSATIFNFNGSMTYSSLIVEMNATIGANLTVTGNTFLNDVNVTGQLSVCPEGTVTLNELNSCDGMSPIAVNNDLTMQSGTSLEAQTVNVITLLHVSGFSTFDEIISADGGIETCNSGSITTTSIFGCSNVPVSFPDGINTPQTITTTINSTTIYNSGVVSTCGNGKIQTSEIDTCSGGNLNITAPVVISGGNGLTSSGGITSQSTLSVSSTSTLTGLVTSPAGFSACPAGTTTTDKLSSCSGSSINVTNDMSLLSGTTLTTDNLISSTLSSTTITATNGIFTNLNVTNLYSTGDLDICSSNGKIKTNEIDTCSGGNLNITGNTIISDGKSLTVSGALTGESTLSISSTSTLTGLVTSPAGFSACPAGTTTTDKLSSCSGLINVTSNLSMLSGTTLSADTLTATSATITTSSITNLISTTINTTNLYASNDIQGFGGLTIGGASILTGLVTSPTGFSACPGGTTSTNKLASCSGPINVTSSMTMLSGTTLAADTLTANTASITTATITSATITNLVAPTLNVTNIYASSSVDTCNSGSIKTNTIDTCPGGTLDITGPATISGGNTLTVSGAMTGQSTLSISSTSTLTGLVTSPAGFSACPAGTTSTNKLSSCSGSPINVTSSMTMLTGTTLATDTLTANTATFTTASIANGIFTTINSTNIYASNNLQALGNFLVAGTSTQNGLVSSTTGFSACPSGTTSTNKLSSCSGAINVTNSMTMLSGTTLIADALTATTSSIGTGVFSTLYSTGILQSFGTLSVSSTSNMTGLVTSPAGFSACPSGTVSTDKLSSCSGPINVTSSMTMLSGTTLTASNIVTNSLSTSSISFSSANVTNLFVSSTVDTCPGGKVKTNTIETCAAGNTLNITGNTRVTGTFVSTGAATTAGLTSTGTILASGADITANGGGQFFSGTGLTACNAGTVTTRSLAACTTTLSIIASTLDLDGVTAMTLPLGSHINREVVRIFYQGGIGISDAAGTITTTGFFSPTFPPGGSGHNQCNNNYIDCSSITDVFGPFIHNNAIGMNYRMKIEIFINNPGSPAQSCSGNIKLINNVAEYIYQQTTYRQANKVTFVLDHLVPFKNNGQQFSWNANLIGVSGCSTSLNVNSLTISILAA